VALLLAFMQVFTLIYFIEKSQKDIIIFWDLFSTMIFQLLFLPNPNRESPNNCMKIQQSDKEVQDVAI